MFNNFGGGQSLGSLQWSFSAWAKSGTPCTYSVCKALRSVPGCLQMEFWSQDVLGILSIPFLNLCFYWHETNGWSTLEQKGNQLYCVQQPCSVTLYRNGSLMDSVRFAPEFADVSKKKMMSQQTLPAATMEIRLSQSQMAKICWMPSVYLLHLQCAQIVLTSNVSSKEAQVLFQETRFAPWSGVH